MFSAQKILRFALAVFVVAHFAAAAEQNRGCVWKATSPSGGVVYLGGSMHALRSTDYPLPPAYNRAFDASERIVFEIDDVAMSKFGAKVDKLGRYPRGDSLRNHVDTRTYEYLRRFFAILKVPEEKFAIYRPWYVAMALQSPELHGLSPDLGIEGFLERRARANHKPVFGLETPREHLEVFSGMSDREAEAALLLTFIPQQKGSPTTAMTLAAWRRGDADALERQMKSAYADFPTFATRLLDLRNRNWIPKIEADANSHHVYFVVAGAGHFGGPNGVLALLRRDGYQIEQL
jgi:hypothetical protein